MKLALTNYQDQAVSHVLDALDDAASRFTKNGKTAAVSLTAVTGAGKTVMAAAALEALLYGNEQVGPNPNLTVLWLTDDRSLNEQTLRKMLIASDRIQPKQLITIDERLDQRILDPAVIYFLNIQKLGKGATKYIQLGDHRQHSLWDSIRQTIRERGSDFLLIIDEAHKGTSDSRNGDRQTIASRLVTGDAAEGAPPAPIVLGITATPQKFHQAVTGAGRLLNPVEVDVEEVRKSGLIKDLVRISYPTETQPSDVTLIEQAVADVCEFEQHWDDYTGESGDPRVRPVLVVQVRAGASDHDLRVILDTIHGAWGGLDDRAIAHSFQEHTRLDLGEHTVRYVGPQDIQDDTHLRVVLFKEALTTGWDCPRAEVMVSLRTARDVTYIAQLIGRMVRTPLARRISSSELLNAVSLYLPHFNADSVDQVIAGLRAGDDQVASDVTTNAVVCRRNTKLPKEVWTVAEALPTYTRPARTHRNEVARLAAFTQLLAATGIDKKAPKTARTHIVATMEREANRLGAELDKAVEQLAKLEYETRTVTTFPTGAPDVVSEDARLVSHRNVDDLFRKARRRFGDAAAKWYWDTLCDKQDDDGEDVDPTTAKLRVAALSQENTAVEVVQRAAAEMVSTLRKEHATKIAELGEADRDKMYLIFQQSRDPQQVSIILPADINASAPKDATRHDKHLYANGSGKYPTRKLNDWEQAVLDERLPEAVAWYRNPSSSSRAVAVPYTIAGEAKTMYPDFVFFREVDGGIIADIIDPHRPDLADTAPKWSGLAAYAIEHKDQLGQVLAIIQGDDGKLWAMDLRNDDVAAKLKQVSTPSEIRELFNTYGGHF